MGFKIFNKEVKRYVKVCPKCKSLKIRAELRSGWFIGLPPSYKCHECGLRSKLFPEISMSEVKKNYIKKKKKKINPNKTWKI